MSEQTKKCEDLIESHLDSRLSAFNDPTTIAECREIVSDYADYSDFDKPDGFDADTDIDDLVEIAEDHGFEQELKEIADNSNGSIHSAFDGLVDDGDIDILDDCIQYATSCRRESMSEGVLSVERVIRFTDEDGNEKSERIDWNDSDELLDWEAEAYIRTDCGECDGCADNDGLPEDQENSECEDPTYESLEFDRVITVLLSWGGPSDGFDFYIGPDGSVSNVVYFYKDWFDGARLEVPSSHINDLAHAYHIEEGISHGF